MEYYSTTKWNELPGHERHGDILKAYNREWDGWMASPVRQTWVWVGSGSWWWTGRPGMLQSMGSQRVGHDWVTELNWNFSHAIFIISKLRVQDFRNYPVWEIHCTGRETGPTGIEWLAQIHVYPVSDAIWQSHRLSSPSPPTFNLSQHEGLLQWLSTLHWVAEVLELQLQHQSLQWVFRIDFL